MSETAAEATGEATAAATEAQGTETQQTEAKPAEAQQAPAWDGKVESLPADVQKLITGLRKEAGDERVAAKTLAAIQKALNPDAKGDEKPTADQLTKALTDRETEARQAKTELAVYKAAGKHGADADALLDSRGFLAKISGIDPSDTKAIDTAIKDAVKDNPKLKTVLAAGQSGGDFSGGSGESRTKASTALPGQPRLAAAYASTSN